MVIPVKRLKVSDILAVHISGDPRREIFDALQKAGYEVPKQLTIGKLVRLDGPDDKPGKKSGWLIYNELDDRSVDGAVFGVASFGSWKSGEKHSWSSKQPKHMNTAERVAYDAQLEAMRAQREAEQVVAWAEAENACRVIYHNASPIPDTGHEYLTKKQITACGDVRFSRGSLVLPVMIDGVITSLQFIDADGVKKFKKGGRIKGGYFAIDGKLPAYVTEGYATGCSLHMATGRKVYVAFNACNLYEVASTANQLEAGRIIIAGDDDTLGLSNTGRTAAEQAASALGVPAVFPKVPTDFNDQHVMNGLYDLKSHLMDARSIFKKRESVQLRDMPELPRMVREIASYFNATSYKDQPLFAITTGLAIGSIVCSRYFCTEPYKAYTSLYLINIAKSGTGKEHIRRTINKIMRAAGCPTLVESGGYTSAAAVLSTLYEKPRHLMIVDEFSHDVRASKQKGETHRKEANTKLMEAYGLCDGNMQMKRYSKIGMNAEQAKAMSLQSMVSNPALTLVGMATPGDMFAAIGVEEIKSGFLNRMLFCISDAQRAVSNPKPDIPVPESIANWIKAINERHGVKADHATENIPQIKLRISDAADALHQEFEAYSVDYANKLEGTGIEDIANRNGDIAAKLALLAALMDNPQAEIVSEDNMRWAIWWTKNSFIKLLEQLKCRVSSSDYEGMKLEALNAIREAGPSGITLTSMFKRKPFSAWRKRDRDEVLNDLQSADLVFSEQKEADGRGRASTVFYATGD